MEVDVTKLIGEEKIEINHTNNDNSSGGSGVIVTNNHAEDLIVALQEQIVLLKSINENLKTENLTLKSQLSKK